MASYYPSYPVFQPAPAVPSGYPPGHPPQGQNAYAPPPPPAPIHSYHPRVGFTRLSSQFYIWNVFTSNTSCLELGPQHKGPVAYSAKMFSGSRLKVKEGPWTSNQSPVCTIEARHPFSQKSTISFNGFQSKIKETSQWHEGVAWPFDVDGGVQPQRWEWRKESTQNSSSLKRLIGMGSDKTLGTWKLVPAGGSGQPVATFQAGGGNTFEEDAALGYFQFHGPAANGGLGDVFNNVAIAVLLRIISQHYVGRLASLAS